MERFPVFGLLAQVEQDLFFASYLRRKADGILEDDRRIPAGGCVLNFFQKSVYGWKSVLTLIFGYFFSKSAMSLC